MQVTVHMTSLEPYSQLVAVRLGDTADGLEGRLVVKVVHLERPTMGESKVLIEDVFGADGYLVDRIMPAEHANAADMIISRGA